MTKSHPGAGHPGNRRRQAQLILTGVLGAFFLSGVCSLIHEIVWTRLLRLVMGNTTFAITTVLCVFMAGLALGSYVGGRLIDRRNDALRIFAILEGLIGAYCLMLPFLIDSTEPIYRLIYQNTHTSFYVFSLIRFFFCGLLLLLPATLMGATLPILSKFFVQLTDRVGWSVGRLYALNTFGAAVGAAVTGFLLIPKLGVTTTILTACLLNFGICIAAYLLHRRMMRWFPETDSARDAIQQKTSRRKTKKTRKAEKPKKFTEQPLPEHQVAYGQRALTVLLIVYGFSGFSALIYEIAWTRVLSLLIGSSVYAFGLMLTAFILGLATGSMAFAKYADRIRDPMHWLARMQVAIGLSALAVVPLLDRLPFFVTRMISRSGESFWSLQFAEFTLSFVIMFVPTALMGASFPLVSRLFAQRPVGVGRSIGAVYACNTVGSILGSFFGGFVLIPWLGIQHTILAGVMINVFTGCVLFGQCHSLAPRRRGLTAAVALGVTSVAIAVIPAWDVMRISFGPFTQARRHSKEITLSTAALEKMVEERKVLFHKEGLTTTITVKELVTGELTLYVNGKPDASSASDLPTQMLLSHVPMLLHPDPHNVLVIGLASGITLGSVGLHPVETLDCVELAPEMIEATHFFDEFNHNILADPRVRIVVADGRNHLALTDKQYDVIISEPSNPWIAGVADLFTQEFFQLCHQRLSSRGIACIWLEGYHIDQESFRSVVRTFGSVFENVSIWNTESADYLLIGAKEKLEVDHQVLARRMREEAVAADLQQIYIEKSADFLSHQVMGKEGTTRFSKGATIHTDDNALLEFAAPRSLITREAQWDFYNAMEQYREVDLSYLTGDEDQEEALSAVKKETARFAKAKSHMMRARSHIARDHVQQAIVEFQLAAALNPTDPWLRRRVYESLLEARELVKRNKIAEAIGVYQLMLSINPNHAKTHLLLGEIFYQQGKVDEALKYYQSGLKITPESTEALNNVAWILATHPNTKNRDVSEAIRLAERACQLSSYKEANLLDTLTTTYEAADRFSDALATAKRALNLALEADNLRLAKELSSRIEQYEQQISSRTPATP